MLRENHVVAIICGTSDLPNCSQIPKNMHYSASSNKLACQYDCESSLKTHHLRFVPLKQEIFKHNCFLIYILFTIRELGPVYNATRLTVIRRFMSHVLNKLDCTWKWNLSNLLFLPALQVTIMIFFRFIYLFHLYK